MKVSLVSWEGKLEFRSLVVEWGSHGGDQEGGRGHREREREGGGSVQQCALPRRCPWFLVLTGNPWGFQGGCYSV